MSSDLPVAHAAFEPVSQRYIDALNINVQEFRHHNTGAVHYHLQTDNSENVFLVALRTVPEDSTGVAHILEHTALCGSKRYPVRDPFFMMLRRSLNTFMNAMTSSDWTAYPFASQNRKDFSNLLDVYLDAVFFSRLDPLDFAQEGHRLEYSDPNDPSSELVFKGVVFNEMKGAMSSVSSTLWDTLCRHLFPTTTYHFNSGGAPEHIPDLSYEDLKAFYHSHYHPSNAIFMTFGDIPAAEHQAVFEDRALSQFQRLDQQIVVALEQPLPAPLYISDHYAWDDDADSSNKTHIVMGWMLGESTNLEEMLEAQLLSSVLLDNSASPLMHVLETTKLGQSPSPLCGLEDSMRNMVFCCGIEGSEPGHADALEKLVLGVIEEVANNGLPEENLAAVLHQLELHQREISGDHYPYGLQLILSALGPATHYADPIGVLDLEPVIARLRENIRNPSYICDLARRLLLNNSHRLRLVMAPDTTLSAKKSAAEKKRLDAIGQQLSAQQQQDIVQQAKALLDRQGQQDDPGVLPKVGKEDVAADIPQLSPQHNATGPLPCTHYAAGTNGLVYQQLAAPLPDLSDQTLAALPVYTQVITELGIADQDYLAVQHRQSEAVGAIAASTSIRGAVDDEQQVSGFFTLSSKALFRNVKQQSALMRDTLEKVVFSEQARIKDLISQQRARREQSITGSGHSLAMTAACAGMSPLARLNHQLSGLAGIAAIRELDKQLQNDKELDAFSTQLASMHQQLIAVPAELLVIAEDHRLEHVREANNGIWQGWRCNTDGGQFSLPPLRESIKELWVTNTQVNFCARAYPTVPVQHPDAAALSVLGGFLRNGFLHRAVREQGGAYGGGSSQDSSIAAFRFFSYRDPRMADTLADFDAAINWMLESTHDEQSLEEAVLGVISSLDKPGSPAGEARQHYINAKFGRTHEQRKVFRQRVLNVSLADLTTVTELYLKPDKASTAVITNSVGRDDNSTLINRLDLQIREL